MAETFEYHTLDGKKLIPELALFDLIERFQNLESAFGASKGSSFEVKIMKAPKYQEVEGQWSIELGCYDISNWPRHLELGPFKTIEETVVALNEKVERAEKLALLELERRDYDIDEDSDW